LYLFNLYKIDFTLLGVFRELSTIPMLFLQLVFLVCGIIMLGTWKRNAPKFGALLSVVLLSATSIVTIGSFFGLEFFLNN